MTWKKWVTGLIGAFIQGGASSITAGVIAPDSFNFGDQLSNVMWLSLISGIFGAALFLKTKPLPGLED